MAIIPIIAMSGEESPFWDTDPNPGLQLVDTTNFFRIGKGYFLFVWQNAGANPSTFDIIEFPDSKHGRNMNIPFTVDNAQRSTQCAKIGPYNADGYESTNAGSPMHGEFIWTAGDAIGDCFAAVIKY